MSIVDKLSSRLAAELHQTEKEKEIYQYALALWGHTFINIVVMAVIGYFLGVLKYTICMAATAMALRNFSGGHHSHSPIVCSLISTGVIITGSLVAKFLPINATIQVVFFFTLLIALLVVAKYAPVDSPSKPITNWRQRKFLKNASLVILAIYFVVSFFVGNRALLAMELGLLWQTFTLLPVSLWFFEGFKAGKAREQSKGGGLHIKGLKE